MALRDRAIWSGTAVDVLVVPPGEYEDENGTTNDTLALVFRDSCGNSWVIESEGKEDLLGFLDQCLQKTGYA